MQHPDEGTIHAWLDGALSSDERAAIEAHVRECAECAAAAAEARGMIAGATRILSALDDTLMRAAPAPDTAVAGSTQGRRSAWRALRLTPLRAVLAASLMVIAASALAIRHAGTGAVGAPGTDSSAAPLLSQARSPAAPAPAPVTRASVTPAPAESRPAAKKAVSPPPATRPPVSVASAAAAGRDAARPAPDAGTVERVAARVPDSARPRPTASAGAAMLDTRRAMMRSAVTRRESATIPAAESATSLAGCYQLLRDSSDLPSPMPDRFALEGAVSGAASGAAPATLAGNRVRALTTEGRPGNVIEAASWRSTGPATALVSWHEGSLQAVLSLERAGDEIVARLAFGPGVRRVRVISLPCDR